MKTLALVAATLLVTGCSYKKHSAPGFGAQFASVDYTVLGETSAEACGTYVFGIDLGHLFQDKSGGSSGGGGGDPISMILAMLSGNAEESRALYEALDKMPEATNLAAHRTHMTYDGLTMGKSTMVLFGRSCATVVAHGVKMGKGPVPNAN